MTPDRQGHNRQKGVFPAAEHPARVTHQQPKTSGKPSTHKAFIKRKYTYR